MITDEMTKTFTKLVAGTLASNIEDFFRIKSMLDNPEFTVNKTAETISVKIEVGEEVKTFLYIPEKRILVVSTKRIVCNVFEYQTFYVPTYLRSIKSKVFKDF